MGDPFSNPWRFTGARSLYDNPWIRVEALEGVPPQGPPRDYTVVRAKKHAVGVLPIAEDGCVHLVGQWRVPVAAYSWEMPEGGSEPGESLEACARRECEEEAGVIPGRLIPAIQMDLSNSFCDEQATCFLGLDLRPGVMRPDPTEVFQQRRLPFKAVLDEVAQGAIRDAMTVATVLRAHHMAISGALDSDLRRAMLGT